MEQDDLLRSNIYSSVDNLSNHFKVLTQMAGSAWPRVMPLCLVNGGLTILVCSDRKRLGFLTWADSSGHKYLLTMMAFLLVTRLKIILDRYFLNAKHLTGCFHSFRELTQFLCLLTGTDTSISARLYRQNVLYKMIVLLRVTCSVLEMRSSGLDPSSLAELSYEELHDLQHHHSSSRSLDHLRHTSKRHTLEDATKTPILLAYNLRREILRARHEPGVWLREKTFIHPCNEELKLLDCVSDFLKSYHGLVAMLLTPTPFPLVHLTKAFLFVTVFSLPFALCTAYKSVLTCCLFVMFITAGYFGLEEVAMELSDVFGNDFSDIDDLGLANQCFEDCYIAIYKIDGEEAARELRKRVVGRLSSE